ncbi:universal stress protein [Glycomyces sp. L485]|uniref:universal stress protein n=1 Tax=Glycomyces sp. L485 TaxID=2909235 RepID=UPI001F4B0B2C|nr:universal stress protein [Glycomyces sp. L485]MCH7230698.1 universal stress protein [Glycomyces sp. L485]
MTNEARRTGRIVVGIDGSPSSVRALRWAIGQAKATGATVEVVYAWEVPPTYGTVVAVWPSDALEANARELLGEVMNQVEAEAADVELERYVEEGHAAAVLLRHSEDADLLVVGNRGHGGFAGALLGSVSQHCIHHATCPVVVIPGKD